MSTTATQIFGVSFHKQTSPESIIVTARRKNQRFRAKGAFLPKGECTFCAQRELSRENCQRRRMGGSSWLLILARLATGFVQIFFLGKPTIKQTKLALESLVSSTLAEAPVLYRHVDGRNKNADCPSGLEMIILLVGAVGAIDHILTPTEGVKIVGERLPPGGLWVASGYQCESGAVTLCLTRVEIVMRDAADAAYDNF
jgi:hypothetical protein